MSVETFDAGWLGLREPIDHRCRSPFVATVLHKWWSENGSSRVLDLGTGTGSNLRYLAPLLSGPQQWTLLDHDPDLLSRIRAPSPEVSVTPVRGELADEGLDAIRRADLVTGSALLDLVSADWVSSLVERCVTAECAVLFSLTYDGTIQWSVSHGSEEESPDPEDELVRTAVNAHQRGDKGLGPALGPTAASFAKGSLQEGGYRTWLRPSPWQLGPSEAKLAQALVAGWVEAAIQQVPEEAERLHAWAGRRFSTIANGEFALTVGHQDLLALPHGETPDST